MKNKGTKIAKAILKRKSKVRGNILPHFKTYFIAIIFKIMWYCWKDKHRGKWNSVGNPV